MVIKGKGHIPLRTCISCGSKQAKNNLIRVLLDENARLIIDSKGTGQGRASYVCRKNDCVGNLSKNRKLNRSLRTEKKILYTDEAFSSVLPES